VIAALILITVTGWGYWLIHRAARSPQVTTPVAAPAGKATGATTALGLEDDPDQWRAWTALDERQLTRLLADSARVNRPATYSIDDAVPHSEHEDTP
jgi:hypothetical protein